MSIRVAGIRISQDPENDMAYNVGRRVKGCGFRICWEGRAALKAKGDRGEVELDLFLSARSWITMRLSQPVRSQTFSEARDKGSAVTKRPAARIRRQRKHELPQLIEPSNGRKLWL